MSLLDKIAEYGSDIKEGAERFMGNTDLYCRMLKKLPSAAAELDVMENMKAGDWEKALENAHTLKGVTGNLSITPLFKAYENIVNLLRAGENEAAQRVMEEIIPVQRNIIECIAEEC